VQKYDATKTLVVLDNWATIETHSSMFNYLEEQLNHRLVFEMADSKIKFQEHDQYQFDNVILMAPSVKES